MERAEDALRRRRQQNERECGCGGQPRAVAIVLASMVAVARFAYAGRGKLPGDVELQLQRNEYVLSADAKLLSPVERAAPGRGEP